MNTDQDKLEILKKSSSLFVFEKKTDNLILAVFFLLIALLLGLTAIFA
jgi:hypothetical protein